MGYITTDVINNNFTPRPKVFVETGTYIGGIPLRMLNDGTFYEWDKVYTIELSEDNCKMASFKYSIYENGGNNDDINKHPGEKDESFKDRKEFFDGKLVLLQGDSSEKLKDVLSEVNEPIFFWLDAHSGTNKLYARGEVDCPLLNELTIIKTHSIKNHSIAIDDADKFGVKHMNGDEIKCDYTDINKFEVVRKLREINMGYEIEVLDIRSGTPMLVARCLEEFKPYQ